MNAAPDVPEDRPFLTDPTVQGEAAAGAVPAALYDLAVNRAWLVLRGVGRLDSLAAWHARTRFARRVSLAQVHHSLATHPGSGEWHWAGGPDGMWVPGRAPFP